MMAPAESAVDTLRDAARAMLSVTIDAPDEVRAIRRAINALSARESELLADIAETGVPEAEGASSVSTWARRELHQDSGKTRAQVRGAHALRDLPAVAEAARAGLIGSRHVESFAYAIRFCGFESTRLIEEPLLELALQLPPEDFHARVREIRATYHPDELDKAWLRGMDKCDFTLVRTLDGWHPVGFLPIDVGAKFKALLDSLSVPRDEGDNRRSSTRRVDALDTLLTSVLDSGLPSDNGVRAHLHVVVRDDKPADLESFGPIGAALAALIGCSAEMTPYLVNEAGDVTGIGRSKRRATPSQAKIIRLRQGGVCARPGCRHPIAHNHHVRWWSEGGDTELDNLVGLCRKCHSLVHLGRIQLPESRARTG
jgi:hypothetical protein